MARNGRAGSIPARGTEIRFTDTGKADFSFETLLLFASARATAFRIWATGILKEYIKKAEEEYNEFNKTQKIVSDFDKEINLLLGPDSD